MHASYATYDFSLSGAVSMVAGTRSHVQVVALPSFSTKTSLTTFLLRRPRSLVRHPILLFAHSLCRANHPSRYRFGTGPAAALVHLAPVAPQSRPVAPRYEQGRQQVQPLRVAAGTIQESQPGKLIHVLPHLVFERMAQQRNVRTQTTTH